MKYDKVHQIYNKFLEMLDIDPTLVKIILERWFELLVFMSNE